MKKNKVLSGKRPILLWLVIVATWQGCIPLEKQLVFYQKDGTAYEVAIPDSMAFQKLDSNKIEWKSYELRPGDVLYIELITPVVTDFQGFSEGRQANQLGQSEQTGYTINDEGYLTLPMLGKIKAAGLTVLKLEDTLTERLSTMFNGAIARVRLLSYTFSVLGEVRSPGKRQSNSGKLHIIEAISMAGGPGDYANLSRVKVIRSRADDMLTVSYVDITNMRSVDNELFYIYPDDIVFVEPLMYKQFAINRSIPLIIGILSGTALFFSIIVRTIPNN